MPRPRQQLEDILAIPGETAILASAKEGIGIEEILEAIVERVPPPKPTGAGVLQALGFDSYFDTYKGVVTHVRVFDGELRTGNAGETAAFGQERRNQGSRAASIPSPTSAEKLEDRRDRLHHGQYQKPPGR